MEVFTGVTNPYALAEALVGRRIKWDKVAEPERLLANILRVSEERLFDLAESPVLAPHLEVGPEGEISLLSDQEARGRLEALMAKEAPKSAGEDQPLGAVSQEKMLEMASDLLFAGTESGRPWNPPNTVWVDKGDFFEDVDEYNDPIQGYLGDCYFIAGMSSVAWARPYAIVNVIRPSALGEESPIHRVDFFEGGSKRESVEVTEKVPVRKGNLQWIYARSKDAGEIWPAVLEKAYAKWKTKNSTDQPDYTKIAGGDPVRACAEILGGRRSYYRNRDHSATKLWNLVRGNSLSYRTVNPMVAWTFCRPPSHLDYRRARVVACHAYSVLGWAYRNREKFIVLRNPWGTHHATLDTLSGHWWAYMGYWQPVPLNQDGVFAMRAETFKEYFAGLGVCR